MLKIKEEHDYTKHSLAKKGFHREYLNEEGVMVEDKEHNDKCNANTNVDLSKVFAEEDKETEGSFFKKLCAFLSKKK